MKWLFKRNIYITAIVSCLILSMSACNEKDDGSSQSSYTPSESVAVNAFALHTNPKVMANLDSVYFSIDLTNGVIFNADSLPMGTDVSHLIADISFPSTVTSAVIEMTDGTHRTGTFDYKANSLDSIDFTGNVTMTLSASDAITKKYTIKVNVHKSQPDSIVWDKVAYADLPVENAIAQKTISADNKVISIIKDASGAVILASTTDVASLQWSKTNLSPGFTPDVKSLSFCNGAYYMLSDSGELYSSTNAISWISTGKIWKSIIGAYGEDILGIALNNGVYVHTSYPGNMTPEAVDEDFPIEGFSNLATFSSKWSDNATCFITGGRTVSGEYSSKTWAYDGNLWTDISSVPLPAMQNMTLVPYYIYHQTSTIYEQTEYTIWMTIGGQNPDGTPNRNVYMTIDNGVNWGKAPMLMQLPDYIPSLHSTDVIVANSDKEYDLSKNWETLPTGVPGIAKVSYEITGDVISWKCPYLYIFGGYTQTGLLNSRIWRGVLARLSYYPLF